MQEDLNRCFAITPQDATCRTLAAKAAWVQSDWRISRGQQGTSILEGALAKAVLATQSPEANPDAWQTLAETYLRLARVEQNHPQVRDAYLEKGLSAAQKIYGINPNHALGRATEGALRLLVAQSAPCWPTCTCPMRLMRGCKGTYPSIPFERLVDDGLVVTSAGAEIRSYVHI